MEPAKKKRKVKAVVKQSLVAQAASPHLPPTLTNIVEQYCAAPYFFAQYINNEHKQKKEAITHASISPNGQYIITFGFNPVSNTYSTRVHDTHDGQQQVIIPISENHQPYDVAWNRFSNKAIITYGGTELGTVKLAKYPKTLYGDHSSKNQSDNDDEYYCLRNYNSVSGSPLSLHPHIAYIHHDSKDNKYLVPLTLSERYGTDASYVDQVAFMFSHKHLIAFQSFKQQITMAYKKGNVTHNDREMHKITAVDFSMTHPIMGDLDGNIHISAQTHLFIESSIRAFHGIPIERVLSHPNAIVAMAQKKIRILDRKTSGLIREFEHRGPDTPSHIVLSLDCSTLAYTAGRVLYVKSVHNGDEQKHHVFKDPISSLHIDTRGDLLVTQGGQVIKLLEKIPNT